ncbi:MAG: FeoA domain-containing protein [Acidobacteriota bacterium]|nr:FeoA domain-containing protein [Acidobacteriota bacterium]
MTHPVIALLTAGAAVAVAVLLLWPVRGWLWRGLRALRATERVAIEDALKHLFDFEYNGRAANLQSVSGALAVSGNRAAEILARLQAQELVELEGGGYRLTAEGRRYALRIVRVHRLWERYLSEETGLDPAAWHNEAERLEHTTSAAEADALAARMGHPSHDPHGDPIPTAGGEIGPPRGMPLTELAIGELAEIVHIEDEPEAIYAQLVAEGLHPGMRVRVNESTPRRVRFEADAEEHVLAPVLAANLSVLPLPQEEEMAGPFERLSGLAIGERGRVVALAPALRGAERRRLFDLGLIPGTEVEAELRSPGGDPTGYAIRGAVIALRREQADQVQVERLA